MSGKESHREKIIYSAIGALLGALATIAVKPFEDSWSPDMQLTYKVVKREQVYKMPEVGSLDVRIVNDRWNVGITNLTAYQVTFWNSGRRSIEDLIIEMESEDEKPMFTSIRDFTQTNLYKSLSVVEPKASLRVYEFGHLNPGHKGSVYFIKEGNEGIAVTASAKDLRVKRARESGILATILVILASAIFGSLLGFYGSSIAQWFKIKKEKGSI